MPDSIMYQEGAYVLLEPNQPEQLLTPIELFDRLKAVLAIRQDDLPSDLQRFSDLETQARHLMETSCELDVEPGQFFTVVRGAAGEVSLVGGEKGLVSQINRL